jgi:hypothetical protein
MLAREPVGGCWGQRQGMMMVLSSHLTLALATNGTPRIAITTSQIRNLVLFVSSSMPGRTLHCDSRKFL